LGGRLDRNAGRFGFDQRAIANKLNGVTISVEAADEHTAPAERSAIPIAVRVRAASRGNGIRLFPCFREAAEQHPAVPTPRGTLVRSIAQLFGFGEEARSLFDATAGKYPQRELISFLCFAGSDLHSYVQYYALSYSAV
jgi:hypothetical protein